MDIPNRNPVLNKTDFAKRYQEGEFGNASPTWDNLRDWMDNCELPGKTLYHLRNRNRGGPTLYNIPKRELIDGWTTMLQKGVSPKDIYISAMCPTEKTTLQGEVMETGEGLYLYYTRVAKPMREALREASSHATGLGAVSLLRTYLDANSYEWLQELLSLYPGHVVEFTSLSTCWGTLPRYNTLFWEVRYY